MEKDGSVTPLGKEHRIQLSIAERKELLAQVNEIKVTDTGCWFELPSDNQLRMNYQGKNVEFKRVGEKWHFSRVTYPIVM